MQFRTQWNHFVIVSTQVNIKSFFSVSLYAIWVVYASIQGVISNYDIEMLSGGYSNTNTVGVVYLSIMGIWVQ
jgi:hypothetical protein